MTPSKRTAQLASQLEASNGGGPIEVVLELDGGEVSLPEHLPRARRRDVRRQAFEAGAEPVIARVQAAGGEVTAALWLNDTLYVTVAPDAIEDLEQMDEVRMIDVPGEVTFHD